jgi:hypothetical protein
MFLFHTMNTRNHTYFQHHVTPAVLPIVEKNLVPDAVIRFGIQRELEMELQKINKLTVEEKAEKNRKFVEELKRMPIAIEQKKANDQHYEVPDEFFYTGNRSSRRPATLS